MFSPPLGPCCRVHFFACKGVHDLRGVNRVNFLRLLGSRRKTEKTEQKVCVDFLAPEESILLQEPPNHSTCYSQPDSWGNEKKTS